VDDAPKLGLVVVPRIPWQNATTRSGALALAPPGLDLPLVVMSLVVR